MYVAAGWRLFDCIRWQPLLCWCGLRTLVFTGAPRGSPMPIHAVKTAPLFLTGTPRESLESVVAAQVLDALNLPILMAREDGRVAMANSAAATLLGKSVDTLI